MARSGRQKVSQANQVKALRAEIARLREQTAASNSDSSTTNQKRALIPKPAGQPGRHYNIQEAMGLEENTPRYNRLMGIIRRLSYEFIHEPKSIRYQNKGLIQKVVELANQRAEIFRRFEDSWPVRDMLGRHLSNKSTRWKNAIKAERLAAKQDRLGIPQKDREEAGGTIGTSDLDTEEEDLEDHNKEIEMVTRTTKAATKGKKSMSNRREKKDRARKVRKKAEVEDESEKEDLQPSKRQRIAKERRPKTVIANEDSGSDEDPEIDVDERLAKKTRTRKPKVIWDSDSDDELEKHEQNKTNAPAHKEALPRPVPIPVHKKKTMPTMVPAPAQDIDSDLDRDNDAARESYTDNTLIQCPNCPHNVPIDPSPKLGQYLAKRMELVKKHGESSSEVFKYNFTVCLQIKYDREHELYLARARKQGWPTQLNFHMLPDRIVSMEPQLRKLIHDEDTLEDSYIWQTLKSEIPTLGEFAKSRALQEKMADQARPGYYGSKGAAVITSTIIRMFPVLPTAVFAPLSSAIFTSFFLVPQIAASLIAEDTGLPFEDARDLMLETGDYGQRVFVEEDDDPELDEILERNVRIAKGERVAKGKAKVQNDAMDVKDPSDCDERPPKARRKDSKLMANAKPGPSNVHTAQPDKPLTIIIKKPMDKTLTVEDFPLATVTRKRGAKAKAAEPANCKKAPKSTGRKQPARSK